MIFISCFLEQDSSTYNMNMIATYFFILLLAFFICVILSSRLNIYNSSIKQNFQIKTDTANESQKQTMNEVATTFEDIRGAEDEQ